MPTVSAAPGVQAGQDMQTAVSDSLAILLRDVPAEVLSDSSVRWALAVVLTMQQRNYARFLKLLQASTYVQACFVHMVFLEVRFNWAGCTSA
jgi:hypothetical protein